MAWRGRGILTQPTPQMAGWSVMLSPKPVQLRRVCDDATLCASRAAHQQSRARVCITKVDLPSRRNTPSLTDEHRPDCVEKRRISYGVRARMKSEANKSTCTVERGAKGCVWPDLVKREVHCQEKKTVFESVDVGTTTACTRWLRLADICRKRSLSMRKHSLRSRTPQKGTLCGDLSNKKATNCT